MAKSVVICLDKLSANGGSMVEPWKNSNQQIHEWLRKEEISDPDITEIEDYRWFLN